MTAVRPPGAAGARVFFAVTGKIYLGKALFGIQGALEPIAVAIVISDSIVFPLSAVQDLLRLLSLAWRTLRQLHASWLGFCNLPSAQSEGCWLLVGWSLTPELAGRWVEPGIPEIKRVLLGRKRALEIRLSFRGDTPTVATFIKRESAKYFFCFADQIHCVCGHSKPPFRTHYVPSLKNTRASRLCG